MHIYIFNWDSLSTRLKSLYEAQSFKKKKKIINNSRRSLNVIVGCSKYYFHFKIKVVFILSSYNVSASCFSFLYYHL